MATPSFNQLDRLLAGTDFHRSHQADLQTYTPPFFDRYGGGAVATRWPHKAEEVLDLRLAGANDLRWLRLQQCTAEKWPPDSKAIFLEKMVANLHLNDGADPGEAVDHNRDQSAVAQPEEIGLIGRVRCPADSADVSANGSQEKGVSD